jgi:hypothetical protein
MDEQPVALLPTRRRPVVTRPGPPPASAAFTFRPGHYVWPSGRYWTPEQQNADFRFIDSVSDNPHLTGFVVHVNWAYFEGAPGDYSAGFRIVDAYLNRLPPGKHLILHVAERSFGDPTTNVYPPYVINNGWVSVKPADQQWAGGLTSVAKLWQTGVIDRLVALSRAYAVRYDADPRLVMFGLGGAAPDDAYPQTRRWFTESKKVWTRTPLRLYADHSRADDDLLALMGHASSTVVPGGVAIGGPDPELPLPHVTRPIPANRLFRGESPATRDLRGTVPWVGEVRETALGAQYTETPQEIFDYFYHRMRCNYMIWLANTHVGGDAQRWPAILAYIDSICGRIHTGHPSMGTWNSGPGR